MQCIDSAVCMGKALHMGTPDGRLIVRSARLRRVMEVPQVDLFIHIPDSGSPQAAVLHATMCNIITCHLQRHGRHSETLAVVPFNDTC
jgi:hypothetical protein